MRVTTEWLCSCGAWVPSWCLRHPHIRDANVETSLEAMKAARWAGTDPLAGEADNIITHELWTPDHPTRPREAV